MDLTNDVLVKAAQDAIKEGNTEKAMELLKKAVQQDPKDFRLWTMMIRLAPTREAGMSYLHQAQAIYAETSSIEDESVLIENEIIDDAIIEITPDTQKTSRFTSWLKELPKYISLLYLVLLAIAEVLTTSDKQPLGMLLHGFVMLALIIHGSLYGLVRERAFFLTLSFAPLIRLVSLTTPLSSFPPVYWYAIVGVPLFLAAYALIRVTGLTGQQIGLKSGRIIPQLLVSLTGIALGYFEFVILKPEPLVTQFSWETILVPAIILLIFTGFLEELIFRGVFQYFALRHLGRWGFYYVAVIFAVLHIGYQSILDVVFVFLVAIFFGYIARRTGSILGVTIAHGLTNIGLFLIYPFIF